MRLPTIIAAIATISVTPALAAPAHFEAGILTCDLSGDVGDVLGSKQDMTCTFKPSAPGAEVRYTGSIDQFGIDLGEITKARLVWAVDAVSKQSAYDLQGVYRGVEANAAVGIGVGATILTGGSHGTLSLQPIGVDGEEGLNVAVGVEQLELKPAI